MKTIPNYHPPQDYRRPTKTQEKVYVPVNDYPEINFSMIANPLPPGSVLSLLLTLLALIFSLHFYARVPSFPAPSHLSLIAWFPSHVP